jgi:hypothetical protein
MKKIKAEEIVKVSQKPFPEIKDWLNNIFRKEGGYASLILLEDQKTKYIKYFNGRSTSGGFSEVHSPKRIAIILATSFSGFENPFDYFPGLAKMISQNN